MSKLRDLVMAQAPAEGRNLLPVPGMWAFRADAPMPPKRVDTQMVTMAVILQGEKTVRFGDREMTYAPGEYLFVTGEQKYASSLAGASPEHPYLSVAVELPPEEIAAVLVELADAGVEPGGEEEDLEAMVLDLEPAMLDALERLVAAIPDPIERALVHPLARRELMLRLLSGVAGTYLRHSAGKDDGRIRRALDYLDQRACERVTVGEVAKQVAMSPSHFAHRFREVVRMSPMQYVKHVRLQKARLQMLGEGMGAAEAANAVGYASASHFTRDFKGYFGEPPLTYVQRLRAGS